MNGRYQIPTTAYNLTSVDPSQTQNQPMYGGNTAAMGSGMSPAYMGPQTNYDLSAPAPSPISPEMQPDEEYVKLSIDIAPNSSSLQGLAGALLHSGDEGWDPEKEEFVSTSDFYHFDDSKYDTDDLARTAYLGSGKSAISYRFYDKDREVSAKYNKSLDEIGSWKRTEIQLRDEKAHAFAMLFEERPMELGELAGMRKADIESVKGFITCTDDRYRPAYGRQVETHPRTSIIVGTTNSETGFLRDVTGNRRFWPVTVKGRSDGRTPWDMDQAEIDQVWAEAKVRHVEGETLFLDSSISIEAEKRQTEAMEQDERQGLVEAYLDVLLPPDWNGMDIGQRRTYLSFYNPDSPPVGSVRREYVCNLEIWAECFGNDPTRITRKESYDISSIMASIDGWQPIQNSQNGRRRFPIYGQQRGLRRCETGTRQPMSQQPSPNWADELLKKK